ncbi:MAG: hypothetical protein AAF618_00850 [Pseudomonadota bacterium]
MALDQAPRQELPDELRGDALPDILLPYQQELIALTSQNALTVCEKSRRIGMTWGVASDAVLTSAAARSAGGMDTLYIGYNLDMAREFIDTCGMWAKAFVPAAGDVDEFLFVDKDEDGAEKHIQAFRIRFASGFEIVALTSKPRSLRGRQGYVIFDEAAFHDELGELLKAAMAMMIWGGKVLVISTHDGADNPFNQLIQDIRSGKRAGVVLKVTFDDAVAQGLYERIALVTGKPATAGARAAWVQKTYDFYGEDADEELHVIPRASSGAYLTGAAIEACMDASHVVARLTCPDGFELRPISERRRFVERWLAEHVTPHLGALSKGRWQGLGEDFARTTDLTVLAIGEEREDLSIAVPLMIELKNCPIAQQRQIVFHVLRALPRFRAAKFDATGNGLGLAEDTQEEFGHERVEAVKLSTAWYLEHMPVLKRHIEDRSTSLPQDTAIRDDLRAVRLVRGVPTIPDKRDAGRHGDAAVALAMLYAAMKAEVEEYGFERVPGAASIYIDAADPRYDDEELALTSRGAW